MTPTPITTIHANLNGSGGIVIDIQTRNEGAVGHKFYGITGCEAGVLRDELNEVLRVMNRVG